MNRKISTGVGPLAVRMRGKGPPAVLWHSLFVDERSWDRVEGELAAERRVVSITGPGHGASGDPGRRYTIAECAEAAGVVLDELGIDEPVDWVGNAWGGHVGIVFATEAAPRCRTLVTLGTPVQSLNRAERVRTVFLLAAHRAFGPVGFIRSGVTNVLLSAKTRQRDPEAVALVGGCLARAERAALRNAVVSISLHRPDLTDHLPRLSVPTLFVTGGDHKGWTPEQARAASRLLPHGSCAVVDGAAYLVPLEAPAETTALVRRFWATALPGHP